MQKLEEFQIIYRRGGAITCGPLENDIDYKCRSALYPKEGFS